MKLAYDETGEGQAMVFLHGFPHNRTLWSGQLDFFRDHARCIAPDLRGFGESVPMDPYSIDVYADDVANLLRDVGARDAIVVGLSMGGYVAFSLWRRHRKLIRALALADTRAGADNDEGKKKRDDSIKIVESQGVAALANLQITGMLGKSTRERSPEIVSRILKMLASAPRAGVVGALGAMRDRVDSTALLGTIDVPTAIIVGDEDVLTPPKESRAMQERITGSSLDIIEGAGHLSNVEQPDAFNGALLKFLRRVQ